MTAPNPSSATPMVLQGRLLTDPALPPEPGWLRIQAGRIVEIGLGDSIPGGDPPVLGGPARVICPAFIDAHTHLPQTDCVGCDGLPLLQWLDEIVFPAEAWWGRGAAPRDARTALLRMAEQGTVGAAAYLTSHAQPAAQVLELLSRTPMRWHAGRVAMDRGAPDDLTAEDRARARMRPIPSPIAPDPASPGRLHVSANPRFAPACTAELLAEIAWAARDRNGSGREPPFIQTHLAEDVHECALVARLFPEALSYTHVYDVHHLLSPRTLLAHAIHLDQPQWELIARRNAVVIHCPGANLFLRSGLFDYAAAMRHGVRVGLGSDIAAGPDVAMPRVARAFIETAKLRSMTIAPGAPVPTPALAWELITRANADLLGWSDSGRLAVGAAADLLVLRPPETWLDAHLVGRLLYNWSKGLIESRVFAGALVDPARLG